MNVQDLLSLIGRCDVVLVILVDLLAGHRPADLCILGTEAPGRRAGQGVINAWLASQLSLWPRKPYFKMFDKKQFFLNILKKN